MSHKAEFIADNSGTWSSNALRFATAAEADDYAKNLAGRWTSVREKRVVESTDPVNYSFIDGVLLELKDQPASS